MNAASPNTLTEGSYITPTVRLVRQLGQGGMGSVWVADHLALRTQVVVKFMSERLSSDATSVARFTREAAAAAQIKSPHVVQVFDHGVTPQGIPFIVMELLEGHDLAHHLKQHNGFLPPQEMGIILHQVAKALGKAHERGIVHRDIKPENIYLCDGGSGELFVKLLDFGIAKGGDALSNATSTGAVMGTPYYMSPEQMVGAKNVDFRSDLWSLGVVAYQALTGTRPFDGDTYGALAIAIHSAPLVPPSRVNPRLPPTIDQWFAKVCARDPAERFNSAKELADAYVAAVAGQPLTDSGNFAPAGGGAAGSGQFVGLPGGFTTQSGAAGTAPPLTSQTDPNAASQASVQRKKGSGGTIAIVIAGLLVAGGLVAGGLIFLNGNGAKRDGGSEKSSKTKDDKDDKDKGDKTDKGDEDKDKDKPKPSDEPTSDPTAKPGGSGEPSAKATASGTAAPTVTAPSLPTGPVVIGPTVKPTASTKPTASAKPTASTKPTAKPTGGKYDDDIK